MSVKPGPDDQSVAATLFVPSVASKTLSKLVERYRDKDHSLSGEALNRPLVESISKFRIAALKQLWTDPDSVFPAPGSPFNWEVWLRSDATERFRAKAVELDIETGRSGLSFPEAAVLRVVATPEQMAKLVAETNAVAELRRQTVTADFFMSQPRADQLGWVDNLLARTEPKSDDSSAVRICILDTGLNISHPLIQPSCSASDCHVVEKSWGSGDDHHGHGTELAGIALFGDLTSTLQHSDNIAISHRLESVMVIPPTGYNPYDLLGAITRDAVTLVESANPAIADRIFCLASTTSDDAGHFGAPTSWASELDQISAGVSNDQPRRRLICVSAGNIGGAVYASQYPQRNDAAEIESPAHSWNALTVGALTEKIVLTNTTFAGYTPMAPSGDISPNSRTASWDDTWPIKPDLVLEGGNLAAEPGTGYGADADDLALLTTSKDFPSPSFMTTRDTSAATAEAARLAAELLSQNPGLWPETVRALLVGSARWTNAMRSHLPSRGKPRAIDYKTLLKRYGHGVPNAESATFSASNHLTLIVEDELQPYAWKDEKEKDTILNEMVLYPLPWPTEVLESLGTNEVHLRVALSYFVEPNPSEAQRGRKLRYGSHGLRFRVRLPDETDDDFRKRINKAALDAGEKVSASDSKGWVLGPTNREVGSIHCDTWIGPASDLARRSSIAVYPVAGWWKERPHLGNVERTARFSLVVTIDAGEADVDIYTSVEIAIANTISV